MGVFKLAPIATAVRCRAGIVDLSHSEEEQILGILRAYVLCSLSALDVECSLPPVDCSLTLDTFEPIVEESCGECERERSLTSGDADAGRLLRMIMLYLYVSANVRID
jgi:hypothetical protein